MKGANKTGKIKPIAVDKTTKKKVGETNLKGYNNKKVEENFDYYKSIPVDKKVYVLWTKTKKKVFELHT